MIDGKRKKVLDMAWTLAVYYSAKCYAVSREVGLPYLETAKNRFWTKQRADFVAVNKKHDVVIVEMKSCWSDYANDRKWRRYLPHCNQFYFGADTETARRIAEDLNSDMEEKRVGVIAFEPCGESFRMKFLRPARKYAREVPIFYMLWQMAARSFDCPWNAEVKK